MKIASYKKTKEVIGEYDFIFKKKLGQNFLIDAHVLDKIINSAGITTEDVVIEIGPGIGSLTEELCQRAYKVIAIEIDSNLISILKDTLSSYSNLEIINEDVLKVDIRKLIDLHPNKNFKVVANLPYYITTPIVMSFLENRLKIKSMTVMVQKEVAYRMKAEPGTKDYGAISIAINYYSKPYLVANVPRNCFMPRPNVDSAVISLEVLEEPSIKVIDDKLMFGIVRAVFNQRRKTLLNCLYNQWSSDYSKEMISDIITKAGFDTNVRGETFTLQDFAKLSDEFSKNN